MTRADDVARSLTWLKNQGPTRLSLAPEHSAECLASLIAEVRAETIRSACLAVASMGRVKRSPTLFIEAIRALAKESAK